jgi:sugar O-acyltransferase (sialic acid O-acetyltransferase NeuD family)
MTDLLIFPYNGNGIEAMDCISGEYNFLGFIDDLKEKQGVSFTNHPVFDRDALRKYKSAKVLAVPGGPLTYKEKVQNIDSLQLPQSRFAQIIHPAANVSKHAKLGFNLLIMAGVVITAKAFIGNHVCILPNTVIHHDSFIEDYTWIGSNVTIAGNVRVGKNCFIGSNSTLINNISIGEGTLVGIGSNVLASFQSNQKLVGNPARNIDNS